MYYNPSCICRYDGIGRRSGLKIRRQRWRAGSTPATGTTAKPLISLGFGGFSMEIGCHSSCVCCCDPDLCLVVSRKSEVPEALPRLGRQVFGGPGGHFSHGQAHKSQLTRKNTQNGLGGAHLGAVAEVGVDVAGGADVAVPQPNLDVLQGHAVGVP